MPRALKVVIGLCAVVGVAVCMAESPEEELARHQAAMRAADECFMRCESPLAIPCITKCYDTDVVHDAVAFGVPYDPPKGMPPRRNMSDLIQPPAPNSTTDTGAVPCGFMDGPALVEILRNVPTHLHTRDEIFGNLYYEYHNLLGQTWYKVGVDCAAIFSRYGGMVEYLEYAAQTLADFRAAADVTNNNR